MSYQLPWWNHPATLYTDSFVHDNAFPISNPGRAAFRSGLYLSRLPRLPHVDLRAEGVYTDPPDPHSIGGSFLFYEGVQKQAYTNRSLLLGDPIGREDKGGDAWLTWHRRPDEDVQLQFRAVKAAKDFIVDGTTQQSVAANFRLRPRRSLELKGSVQGEIWRAPLLREGTQHSVSTTVELTCFPSWGNAAR